MKVNHVYDHHNAAVELAKRELDEWLLDVFEAPAIRIKEGCTASIREHVRQEFEKQGWALSVKIHQDLGLSVFAVKADVAFHLQTGNISRAAYDLLKLQYLFNSGRIRVASLAVPTRESASVLGSNIANAERITSELELFDRVITAPILVIAFQ